jgi:uncharacterized protein (TIGR03000 family)
MFSLTCVAALALTVEASGWCDGEPVPADVFFDLPFLGPPPVDFFFGPPVVEPRHSPPPPPPAPPSRPAPPALRDATFSPNGRYTAAIDAEGVIRVRDLKGGSDLYQFQGGRGDDGFVCFSSDGLYLAAPGTENRVLVIDLVAGRPLRQLGTGKRPATDAKFLDGRTVVARFGDRTLKSLDLRSGEELTSLAEPPGTGKKLAVLPGGDLLFTCVGKDLLAVDLNGFVLRQFTGHQDRVSSFALFKDRKKLVTVSDDRTTRLWDAGTGKQLRQFADYGPGEEPPQSVDVSPDGTVLAEAHGGLIRLRRFNKGTLAQEGKRELRHGGLVSKVAFRPDGQVVLSAGADGQLRLWDVGTGTPVGGAVQEPASVGRDRRGRVLVELPAGAKLFVDGQAVDEDGTRLLLVTPPLEPGRDYFYTLRARVTRDGQVYELGRRVTVRADAESTVVFPRPGSDLPAGPVASGD